MNARGFLLGGAYAAVMVFGWPVLVMCLHRTRRHVHRPARARRGETRRAARMTFTFKFSFNRQNPIQ